MERPRFSLRLMFLVVALISSIVCWRVAVQQTRRSMKGINSNTYQPTLTATETYLKAIEDGQADQDVTPEQRKMDEYDLKLQIIVLKYLLEEPVDPNIWSH